MTHQEFDLFAHHYGGPATPNSPPGLWPHTPLTPREAPLWFRRLKGYPLDRLLEALNDLSMQDRRQAPSVQQVLDALRTLAPPPVPIPAWQQQMARERGLTVAEILAQARPAHGASAVATCSREMFEQGLCQPGQEEAYGAACLRYAAQYPADRAFWEGQAAQCRPTQVQAAASPRGKAPDQAGTFTRLGALVQRRDPHADRL